MGAPITEGQYASLPNSIRLHYASAGEKGRPLLLFVHGFPEFWFEWEAQLSEFGNDWYAVAPDLRGYNLSDIPREVSAYKAKHLIEDLQQLIAHLGYERCVMVAHDWGGAVAWSLAIAAPARLHKLVIINSPHPYLFARDLSNDPEQQAASQYMNWLRKEGSEDALAKDDFARIEALLTNMGVSATPWFTPEVRAKYRSCWARGLAGGVNYYRASPLYPPLHDDPGARRLRLDPKDFRVHVPTLVIWGERDLALRTSLLDGLSDFVHDLTVERIADGTHWVIHEQPERVNRLLRAFLSSA
ncbi:MAG TPA: alpha/beta hydrolase [Noviherbaspirillum sp.]|nr:alpha/beta hydrolase [Noviherbaspirillum sp.]